MRFALGVDDDLRAVPRPLPARPADRAVACARGPWLRIRRRPEPFEALAWAITEQLIEFARAAAIQRRIVRRLGPPLPAHRPARRCPAAATLAGTAPALLQSFDLSAGRAIALRARRARGRVGPGRPARPRPRARLAAPARDPRHRPLDDRDARAPRPGPLRPAPGRRPRPTSSSSGGCADGRPARARDRGRGARVLRALRGLGRPGGDARARAARASETPRLYALARQELVRQRAGRVGRLREQPVVEHPARRRRAHSRGSCQPNGLVVSAGKKTGSVALTRRSLQAAVEVGVGAAAARRRPAAGSCAQRLRAPARAPA